jgi:adenine-specific DNA-methyltransferase
LVTLVDTEFGLTLIPYPNSLSLCATVPTFPRGRTCWTVPSALAQGCNDGGMVPAGPITQVLPATTRAAGFPHLRDMASKYRLIPNLVDISADLSPNSALDAFSGSGVVAYLLMALGVAVTTNDFLAFPTVIAEATVINQRVSLNDADVQQIISPLADDRDLIQRTFDGLYFTAADRVFLDSA